MKAAAKRPPRPRFKDNPQVSPHPTARRRRPPCRSGSGAITPPITRRPAPRRNMRSSVSAVGCIGLFGGDATSRERGARHPHDLRLPPTTRESQHAPLARRDWFSPARESARQPLTSMIRDKPPNARHHPRPHATLMKGKLRGRRVHAVVRCRRRGNYSSLHIAPTAPLLQPWHGLPQSHQSQ
jgi:hypothetical protein